MVSDSLVVQDRPWLYLGLLLRSRTCHEDICKFLADLLFAQMHIHAAALNGSVVTALASALDKGSITSTSFTELPKALPKIPGNATVRAILRAGDATSASPFASGWQAQGWALAVYVCVINSIPLDKTLEYHCSCAT